MRHLEPALAHRLELERMSNYRVKVDSLDKNAFGTFSLVHFLDNYSSQPVNVGSRTAYIFYAEDKDLGRKGLSLSFSLIFSFLSTFHLFASLSFFIHRLLFLF
jgi:hypothetical protein